jgi:hypothetical protein
MGRDVKTRPQRGMPAYAKYHDQISRMREQEQRRETARGRIRRLGVKPTRESKTAPAHLERQSRN